MSSSTSRSTHPPTSPASYFEGERLELSWRYAYRPEFVPLLMSYLGAQRGMRILDVGTGTAFLARLLARSLDDVEVIGLEIDEKMLDLAHQMLVREGLADRIELRKGNAYELPFPDDVFDLVTSQTLL